MPSVEVTKGEVRPLELTLHPVAIVGGLVLGVLNNGMSILGIGSDVQQVIKGLVLLAAVFIDVYHKNKA